MQDDLIFSGVKCPVCNGIFFGEYPGPKTIYHCARKNNTGIYCSGVACKCLHCRKVYSSRNFWKRGNYYVCQICGTPQMEYTDLMKTNDDIHKIHNQLTALEKELHSLR